MRKLDLAVILVLCAVLCTWLMWRYPELRKPEELRIEHITGRWPDGGAVTPTRRVPQWP